MADPKNKGDKEAEAKKEAKAPAKPKAPSIADTAYKALGEGKTNQEVLEIIKEKHPDSDTKMASVT